MKIVIDISDRLIKKVKDHYVNPYEVDEICEAILDSTPLPEHHGRLIDADELLDANIDTFSQQTELKIKFAPTVIEADKEEENETDN